jgi:hypothetical protein
MLLHTKYLMRRIIDLVNKLHERDLSYFSNRLQKNKYAVDEQEQASTEGQHTPPVTIADLRTHVPIRVQTKAEQSRIYRVWRFFKGLFEVIVGVAVVGYTIVSFENWQEQIDATNQLARQTKISRQGLNQTIKNFRTDERAWLIPHFTNEGPFPHASGFGVTNYLAHFQMKNGGKTVAKNIDGAATVLVMRQDEPILLSHCLRGTRLQVAAVFPQDMVEALPEVDESIPGKANLVRPVNLGDAVVQRSLSLGGDRAIIGCGKVTYNDVIDPLTKHFVTFCTVLQSHPPAVHEPNSGLAILPQIYQECNSFNHIDE